MNPKRAVFNVTSDGLFLTEINPLFSVENIKETTGADFKVSRYLKDMLI